MRLTYWPAIIRKEVAGNAARKNRRKERNTAIDHVTARPGWAHRAENHKRHECTVYRGAAAQAFLPL